jgi:hypothetical protein
MTILALWQERAHLSIETVQGVGHPRMVKNSNAGQQDEKGVFACGVSESFRPKRYCEETVARSGPALASGESAFNLDRSE